MTNDNEPMPTAGAVKSDQPQPVKVAVCIPSFDTVKADTMMAMIGLGTFSMQYGVALAFMNEKSSMITKARNHLAEQALQFGADYVLFVDSDLVFPHDALMRLLSHKKDIIGATYNKRVPPYETLGHFLGKPRDLSTGGLVEADFMPGGFLLVKTDVFRAMPQPWFFETYYRSPEDSIAGLTGLIADQYGDLPPQALLDQVAAIPGLNVWLDAQQIGRGEFDTRYMSEDYNFCRKARKFGFTLHCDLDLTGSMAHIGEQHVTCKLTPPDKVAQGTETIDLSAA